MGEQHKIQPVTKRGPLPTDTGIGMSAEELAKVFEPFYRTDPNRPQGTGLGLSVVRRLCDRFGWDVELSSEPGRGTVATIRFA